MTQPQSIVILFAGRFPSEKAAGLFVDLNARSLVEAGARVMVVAPRRLGRGRINETKYKVAYIPTLDLSRIPFFGLVSNYISVATFSFFAFAWLVFKTDRRAIIISNDAFPLLTVSIVRRRLMYEMHDYADRSRWMYRLLFRRVRWILTTNEWKRDKLLAEFAVDPQKIIVERNAVDTSAFGVVEKSAARERLGIANDTKLVVYTGHLYEWKGADTLAKAATLVPEAEFAFVGGTEVDVERFKKGFHHAKNIRIVGHVPHDQIPLWQSAADVLVLPNSAKEEISVHYTSPMKLFEYMASKRPIVASDVPAVREVIPPGVGYLATPDDPASFASSITKALADSGSTEKARRAREIVGEFTWQKHAQRILTRIL